jgi:prephenate dehydratase
VTAYPPRVAPPPNDPHRRIGYLGPAGTFTEQALFTQPDLAEAELTALDSIPDVLAAAADGRIDAGFVPIENAIEGTVADTQDGLAFGVDLLIQREVVIPVQLHLLGVRGATLDGVTKVMSHPHALGQCRAFLERDLPGATLEATNSTADAARLTAEDADPTVAAIATSRAAELYGLDQLTTDIEDHPDNATRFVLVAPRSVAPPTGHDKTSVVIYQRADTPGSLLGILQEFAVRAVNLTRLESRPTRRGLGDYCFLIDLEGHIGDDVVADALRSLKVNQQDVKFLGSYPAAGAAGPTRRAEVDAARRDANAWMDDLLGRVRD